MKCTKCGQNINENSKFCIFCGAKQQKTEAESGISEVMRKLYEDYGAEKILTDNGILVNSLSDLVPNNIIIITRLKLAMNCGLGKKNFHQISLNNKPDFDFTKSVIDLLTNDVGLSDKATAELIGYFDEMIGWKPQASFFLQNKYIDNKNEIKTKEQLIELELYRKEKEEEYLRKRKEENEKNYQNAIRFMELNDYSNAFQIFKSISDYKDSNYQASVCQKRLLEEKQNTKEEERTGNFDKKSLEKIGTEVVNNKHYYPYIWEIAIFPCFVIGLIVGRLRVNYIVFVIIFAIPLIVSFFSKKRFQSDRLGSILSGLGGILMVPLFLFAAVKLIGWILVSIGVISNGPISYEIGLALFFLLYTVIYFRQIRK